MKHRFYNKNKGERDKVQIIIGFYSFSFNILSIFVAWKTGIYLIAIFTFSIVLSIVAPFFDTPSLKKSGKLIYYSPLFITEKPKNGTIQIHGGTLFDYVFVIDKKMNGKQRTNFILQLYIQGLLRLIETYEDKKKTNLKIKGTSYMFNERTAERIGFRIVKTDYAQKTILLYNYFNILISNSIAKNKFEFPKLNKTKTFEADFSTLIERKAFIAKLKNTLDNTIAGKQSTQ